jgi:VanZ family protein
VSPRARAVTAGLAAAGGASFIAWASHQPNPFPALPRGLFSHDKLLHAFAFGLLAFLARKALAGSRLPSGRAFLLAWGLSMGWGVLDEFHQSFIPNREPDVNDVLADAAGAAAGVWLAAAGLRRVKSGASIRA